MKQFSQLFSTLETSNKTNDKISALVHYFSTATEEDKLWLIALFTGKRPKRPVKTNFLKLWAMEISGIPEWLFLESYASVGDLGETIALLLPPSENSIDQSLSVWMKEIIALHDKTDEEKKEFVTNAWKNLDTQERLIFNKLIGGSFRIGVSHKLLVNALSKYSGIDENALMHAIIGKWKVEETQFSELINGENINTDASKLYPFCLAYPLENELEKLGEAKDWQIEYKWDGIRGQIIKRNEEIFIWSRGEELVTEQFPELVENIKKISGNFVLDGEILAIKEGQVLNFNDLQKRLNRKNVSKKMMEEIPVGLYVYDLLELDFEDLRNEKLDVRRQKLENLIQNAENFKSQISNLRLSEIIDFNNWEELHEIREKSREINSEGLMLKSKNSIYHAGRKKGDWWKWKVAPLTIDAVLIYAQKGSGRRSAYYTDYTFAIKDGEKLVTIAKAYSGLTDKEIMEINKFIRNNSLEKFGPVRTVKPELVFEIAFEGIGYSNRHKSGVAVRFPRILRWRKDKTVEEIDTIETVKSLIM